MMNRLVFSPLLVALALVAFVTPNARAADLIRGISLYSKRGD